MVKRKHLNLRLPPEVHAEIVEAARKNKHSINTEIVSRVSQRRMQWIDVPSPRLWRRKWW